jgi:hypothetical protein
MNCRRLLNCLFCALTLTVIAAASDKQTPIQASNVHFTVVKDDNNKPVRNASVVLHPVGKDGKQSKGGFQIKTDNEGKVLYEGLPYGLLRVQVLAPGMQTFGDDYQIDKPELNIEIRMKRPGDQLSLYDKPPDKQKTPPATPPSEPKPQ